MSISATIAKNTFFNGITIWADIALNFFVGIVLARGPGVKQYGTYSYLIWLLSLLVMIVNISLGDMVSRFIAEAEGESDRNKSYGRVQLGLFLRAVAAVVPAVLLLVFSGFWAKLFGVPSCQPYFVLLALRIIGEEDVLTFKQLLASPLKLIRECFSPLITLAEKAVIWQKALPNEGPNSGPLVPWIIP